MRSTGPFLIAFSVFLVCFALGVLGSGHAAEGLDLSIRNNARDFSQRLTREELARAFDRGVEEIPEAEAERTAWIEHRMERRWAKSMMRVPAGTAALLLLSSILCLGWGIGEIIAAKGRRTPQV